MLCDYDTSAAGSTPRSLNFYCSCVLQFICPIWFAGGVVLGHGGGMWRVRERESAPGLDICSGTWYLQLFTPWSTLSLTAETNVFIYEGTKRHRSARSWSQWQCVVWLWDGEWIVFLPLGHTGTNPRQDVVAWDCLQSAAHTHTPLQCLSHLYLTPTCLQGRAPLLPPLLPICRCNDPKIELL